MIDWLTGWLIIWLIDCLIYLSLLSDTFSTSQGPKVCPNPGVLCIWTCKYPSRHRGVPIFQIVTSKNWSRAEVFCTFWLATALRRAIFQIVTSKIGPALRCFVHFDLQMCFAPQRRAIFMSLLKSYLRTRSFSEPTFQTSGTTNHWKNTAIRDFPHIWRVGIFFLVTLLACWSCF